VKAAGDVVQRAFGELGSAGGHRTAAKAVIPLPAWTSQVGSAEPSALRRAVVTRFLHALEGATTPS
jgi:nanoRNase/pAp phosphatase (c-di-AMP/oligoRNAs hydrolase)